MERKIPPREVMKMSASCLAEAELDRALKRVSLLEKLYAWRMGCAEEDARCAVARDLGVAPGTVENIRKSRVKGVYSHVMSAIGRGLHAALSREMQALSHELDLARQSGLDPRDDDMAAAAAALETARAFLKGTRA